VSNSESHERWRAAEAKVRRAKAEAIRTQAEGYEYYGDKRKAEWTARWHESWAEDLERPK